MGEKKREKKKKNGEEVPNRSSLHLFAIDTRSFKSIPWPPIIVGFAAPSPPLPPIISAVSAISFLRFRTVVLDRFRVKQTDSRAYIGDPRLRRDYVFRAVAILVVAISRTDPHASESLFPAIHRGGSLYRLMNSIQPTRPPFLNSRSIRHTAMIFRASIFKHRGIRVDTIRFVTRHRGTLRQASCSVNG